MFVWGRARFPHRKHTLNDFWRMLFLDSLMLLLFFFLFFFCFFFFFSYLLSDKIHIEIGCWWVVRSVSCCYCCLCNWCCLLCFCPLVLYYSFIISQTQTHKLFGYALDFGHHLHFGGEQLIKRSLALPNAIRMIKTVTWTFNGKMCAHHLNWLFAKFNIHARFSMCRAQFVRFFRRNQLWLDTMIIIQIASNASIYIKIYLKSEKQKQRKNTHTHTEHIHSHSKLYG